MPNQPSREELLARLYLIWFYNTYTTIPVDRPEGWVLSGSWPSEFDGPAPREYQPPYPAPGYWPKGAVRFAGEPLLGSGVRITGEFRALRQEAYWPTWEEFWGGTPQWPPPWPPMLPDGSMMEPPSGSEGWEPPMVAPMPPVGNPTLGVGLPEPPFPPGHEPLPPFPPGHGSLPPFPSGHELPPPPPIAQPPVPTDPTVWLRRFRTLIPQLTRQISPFFEELCCIGFNPEESMFEAIISIKSTSSYGGDICSQGGFESVGFWLIEPSWTFRPQLTRVPNGWRGNIAWYHTLAGGNAPAVRIFLGEARVRVYNIPRFIGQINTSNVPGQPMGARTAATGILKYCVRLQLPSELIQFIMDCGQWYNSQQSGSRLPILHCVLGYNQVINDNNYAGTGVKFGSIMDADIQFIKSKPRGFVKEILRSPSSTESQVFPVHVAQLPNKKILMFAGSGNVPYDRDPLTNPNNIRTGEGADPAHADPLPNYLSDSAALFNPETDKLEKLTDPPFDVFCAGHSVMADGKIFIAGGTYEYRADKGFHGHHFPGLADVVIFNPENNSWSKFSVDNQMMNGRWYPSTLVLDDENILVMGGHTGDEDESRHENRDLEIFIPKSDSWYQVRGGLVSTGDTEDDGHIGTYPRLFLLYDYISNEGKVFCATRIRRLDIFPSTGIWSLPSSYSNNDVGTWKKAPTDGQLSIPHHGFPAVMLPLTPDTNGVYNFNVMILADKTSYYCNPLKDKDWKLAAGRIPNYRLYSNLVLLPNGTVLLVGGLNDNGGDPVNSKGILEMEIYTPPDSVNPNGKWETVESINKVRNYHGTTILLYDGRVLIAGSNKDKVDSYESRELSLEIYSPSYLFIGNRPEFIVNQEFTKYGNDLIIRLINGWYSNDINLEKIALMRLCSFTHAFGYDQRYVSIVGKIQKNDEIKISIPTSPLGPNLLPPGYYMLFLISLGGAVSIAKIIHID